MYRKTSAVSITSEGKASRNADNTEILVWPIDFFTLRESRLEAIRNHTSDEIKRKSIGQPYVSGRKVTRNYRRTNKKVIWCLPLYVSLIFGLAALYLGSARAQYAYTN